MILTSIEFDASFVLHEKLTVYYNFDRKAYEGFPKNLYFYEIKYIHGEKFFIGYILNYRKNAEHTNLVVDFPSYFSTGTIRTRADCLKNLVIFQFRRRHGHNL